MTTPLRAAAALLLALLPSALLAQTPVDTAAAVSAAKAAASRWLAVVDGGQYAVSWDDASTSFQGAVPKPAWEQTIATTRAPFDPVGTRQLVGARYTTDLPNAPPGPYVLLQYRTSVPGGKSVVETVVPVLDGERGWRVSGYFVRPE
jgi:hypothetical protein